MTLKKEPSRTMRLSQLSMYVTVYLCLCLIVNVALVVFFMTEHKQRKNQPLAALASPGVSSSQITEELHLPNGQILGCSNLHAVTNLTVIGAGWTKAVYKAYYKDRWVAIKTVHTGGHDMTNCHTDVSVCYQQCASKILKESLLLQQLAHSNVVKVLGECDPGVDYSPGPPVVGLVSIVTELGQPLDVIKILQMSFENRLQLAYDVGKILQHLAASPLGPLLMKDFRRQQFVVVDGVLKLSDVDDLVIGDPHCTRDDECVMMDDNTGSTIVNLTCQAGICRGFNSRLNAVYAGRHFIRLLIPYGCPEPLEAGAIDIVNQQLSGILSSEDVYFRVHQLVKIYSSGAYLTEFDKRFISDYTIHPGVTIENSDFPCLKTVISTGCVQSVSSPSEGAWLCSQMSSCQAFIINDDYTWTGRQVAVFKSSVSKLKESKHQTLYICRGQG
ncbi:extracellular tyrosine-protein kinase PKDCC-like isoform X2 [Macrobrachium rosenbergii]|uniref:extracellular tyrosine-protein kinase PKDCC-like isoform X2 n=1 Tax=Macrobrachium rosenbergii TaxID=79674 RepID=UPI0034D3E9DF